MNLNTFEQYTEAVILAYESKKKDGKLPSYLQHHTPANLKKEFVDEFPRRYKPQDKKIFKLLLGTAENAEEYYQKIRASDSDIFRPLNYYLHGNIVRPRDVTIYLLAWLIDFEPRPFQPGMIYQLGLPEEEVTTGADGPQPESENNKSFGKLQNTLDANVLITPNTKVLEEEVVSRQRLDGVNPVTWIFGIPVKFKRTIIAFCATVAVLASIYVAYILKPHECMYWDGDQYQAIACDQKVEGASTIALDPVRLDEVKRITNMSAITRKDIGKIFYLKESGKVEFYTGSGENPADTRKRLLPMTEHIFEKYVLGLAVSP